MKTVRLGTVGYVRCLKVIAAGNGKVTQHVLRDAAKISRTGAIRFCHCLHDLRIIHVAGWDTAGRYPMPQYALGDEPDAQHPTGKPRPRANKRGASIELVAFASMIRAIQLLPHHGRSLQAETGISPRTTGLFLRAMHEARLAYIAAWEDRGQAGAGAPMYALGFRKRDLPKPQPLSRDEQNRRKTAMRSKRRADRRVISALVNGWADKRSATYRKLLQAQAPVRAADHETASALA